MLKIFKHEGQSLLYIPICVVLLYTLATIVLMLVAKFSDNTFVIIQKGNSLIKIAMAATILGNTGILLNKSAKSIELYRLADISQRKLVFSRSALLLGVVTLTSLILVSEFIAVSAIGYHKAGKAVVDILLRSEYALYKKPFLSWLLCLSNGFCAVALYFMSLSIVPLLRADISKFIKFLGGSAIFIILILFTISVAPQFANLWPEANLNLAGNTSFVMSNGNNMLIRYLPKMEMYSYDYFFFDTAMQSSGTFTINILSVGEMLYYLLLCAVCFIVYSLCYRVYSDGKNMFKDKLSLIKLTSTLLIIISISSFFFYTINPPKVDIENQTDTSYISVNIGNEIDLTQYYSVETVEKCKKNPRLRVKEFWGINYAALENGNMLIKTPIEGEDYILSADKTQLTLLKNINFSITIVVVDKYTQDGYEIVNIVFGESPTYQIIR